MMTRFAISVVSASLLFTSACAEEQHKAAPTIKTSAASFPASSPSDWRGIDAENTLYITTQHGTAVVELAPEFAPKHVAQVKTLTRQKFYDDISFHRVISDFMNQTGDPRGDGTGDSELPDIDAEFIFRRGEDMDVTITGQQMFASGEAEVGFYKAFPVGTQSISMAMLTKDGKVNAWGLHCPNVASMARSSEPNSANSQFFLMRGEALQLNQEYSVWGTTVWGREVLEKIKVGTKGETQGFVPDIMQKVRIAADVPQNERINVQVMRTDSAAFKTYMDSLKTEDGKPANICDIEVPTRLIR